MLRIPQRVANVAVEIELGRDRRGEKNYVFNIQVLAKDVIYE
jgi:hypothetical protein